MTNFKVSFVIDGWSFSCDNALGWMSQDPIDDMSTLVQVMAWCRQATNHYLSQCWPRSMSPYGITRSEWVNTFRPPVFRLHFQMHFLQWKYLNFYWIFTQICSKGPNWEKVNIGIGNDLVPDRRQAITCTNDDPVQCMHHPAGITLITKIAMIFFNSTWPSDAIWRHDLGQHWLK